MYLSLTGVACVRLVGDWWITCFFTVLMHYSLWTFVFSLFGILCEIVMPKQVVESLACWNRDIGRHWIAVIWGPILLCIMWTIW